MEQQKNTAGKKAGSWSLLMGAAFLMATSAIGPGFLTQTATFTNTLAASFGFVILISIILDIFAQTNVWRIIAVSGKRGQEIANMVLPGLGYFIAILVVLGGLAFNIGNIGGAGLGLQVLFGITPETGALISAVVAILIFLIKEAGKAMDRFTQIAGFAMIILTLFVAITSAPPVGQAAANTFAPEQISIFAIVTLVGGTVGGYITFAGGHRLLDAGIKGKEAIPQVTKSSVAGILITSVMRIALFLAVLGVVSKGLHIDESNPAASVFQLAAGNVGYKIFGLIMWSAAITSVIGAAYTSVSFFKTFSPKIERNSRGIIIGFIVISTLAFVTIGQPAKILVLVGSLNGLILPIALGTLLIAAYKKKIIGDYKHPLWLTVSGALVVIVMAIMGVYTLFTQLPQLWS
ncbi:NRAMP family divalent metal transporter [Bacillus spizizenii ATCC 6633 = JCM 2499]|uniref:Putative branched chain amino acids transporter n=1 Tax=Bacillus spizizenii (strain ATCC 23059 / NRRL B-14472 / W23) TaxID=655816 RepID=E0U318_BACSH|nr:NRAMP family divalent metal transporter [Bacillus spizizenii]QCJ15804.1 divalent metal cation transporter [Bacillus subtilis]ADM36479.1 putative branched chain amino acids transporter [Bacillus spizizenii str. W23]AJW85929.1 membrane protein [Bacillus spizizenii]EFG90940.1 putative branched chain amino acids transporter [Bacillus spizizenii ATCC 6633 = JCM 2499]KFK77452.1 natural resistance-associated macrophage family protein [Bacillus spizizenii]